MVVFDAGVLKGKGDPLQRQTDAIKHGFQAFDIVDVHGSILLLGLAIPRDRHPAAETEADAETKQFSVPQEITDVAPLEMLDHFLGRLETQL